MERDVVEIRNPGRQTANRWFSLTGKCSATAILTALALLIALPQKGLAAERSGPEKGAHATGTRGGENRLLISQITQVDDTTSGDKLSASELTALLKTSTSDAKFGTVKVVGNGPDVSILVHGDKTTDKNQKIDAAGTASGT